MRAKWDLVGVFDLGEPRLHVGSVDQSLSSLRPPHFLIFDVISVQTDSSGTFIFRSVPSLNEMSISMNDLLGMEIQRILLDYPDLG